jgi:hypothetical protein
MKTTVKKITAKKTKTVRRRVLVRTHSAGVHVGELVARKGAEVELTNARRVWRWRGANTLNEMSLKGVDSASESNYTRISEPVKRIELIGVIEVIDVTPAAWASLRSAGWAQ